MTDAHETNVAAPATVTLKRERGAPTYPVCLVHETHVGYMQRTGYTVPVRHWRRIVAQSAWMRGAAEIRR